MPPGEEYIWRDRIEGKNAIQEIFAGINNTLANTPNDVYADTEKAKLQIPFAGELYLGHLRYSTTGRSGLQYVHPIF